MNLSDKHREMLKASGISDSVIEDRGYFTSANKQFLGGKGFTRKQLQTITDENPALVIPVFNTVGQEALHIIRPDSPRYADGKPLKYEVPSGARMVLDVPRRAQRENWIGDAARPLFITEGVKKADAAVSRGLCCVAVLGVWNFRGTNELGGNVTLPDFKDIAVNANRPIYIVYDSDVMRNAQVYLAMRELRDLLLRYKAGKDAIRFVYFDDDENGHKVGLDDYLVAHPTGDTVYQIHFESLPHMRALREEQELEVLRKQPRYRRERDGMYYLRPTHNGIQSEYLGNFQLSILADVLQDDGFSEPVRHFEVEGYLAEDERLNGDSRKRRLIPAEQFSACNWIVPLLGARAIIAEGTSVKDRLRFAIQYLSGDVAERVSYRHTGWRKIHGEWTFLHAAGAIDKDGTVSGVRAEVKELDAYALPDPPEGAELQEALRRSLAFLDVADRAQTWPLLAAIYAAPLADILPADFLLWIRGETGSQKTTCATLCLGHFGCVDKRNLGINFTATSTAVELKTFLGKDVPVVIDDYNLAHDTKTQQAMDAVAHRLIGSVGDLSGRDRGQKDGGLQSGKFPRGMVIATAELPPPGAQSRSARTFQVEWFKAAVNYPELTRAQQQDRPYYGQAMAGYLRWLAPQLDKLKREIPDHVRAEAGKLPGGHDRIREAAAKLYLAAAGFLRFCVVTGTITTEEMNTLLTEARGVFTTCAGKTGQDQADRKPSALFLDFVRAALLQGRGFLATKKHGICPDPEQPGKWGYQQPRGNDHEPQPHPSAKKMGWVDLKKGYVHFLPGLVYQPLLEMAGREGVPLPDRTAMVEALDRDGLLAFKMKGRRDHEITAEGAAGQKCWTLKLESLFAQGSEDDDDDDGGGPYSGDPSGDVPPPPGESYGPAPTHEEPAEAPEIVCAHPESLETQKNPGGVGGVGGVGPNRADLGPNGAGSVPDGAGSGEQKLLQRLLQANHPLEEFSKSLQAPGENSSKPVLPLEEKNGVAAPHFVPGSAENGAKKPDSSNSSTKNSTPPSFRTQHTLITASAELSRVIESLTPAPVVGLDIETTGLDPRKDRMRLLSLATERGTWLVDCFQVDPRPLFPLLAERQLVGHNLKFDLSFLGQIGFQPGRVEDTMLLSMLLTAAGTHAPKGTNSVATLVRSALGIELDKEYQRSNWAGPLSAAQLEYAARDAALLLPLQHRMLQRIREEDLETAAEIERRCLPAIVWLEMTGVPFDAAGWLPLAEEAEREAARLRDELNAAAPPVPGTLPGMSQGWNWDSKDIVKRLLREIGFPRDRTTDDELAAIDHPVAQLLRLYRTETTRMQRYGRNWLERIDGGRIYPDWLQCGSRAGRMSCEDPTVQNLPRDKRYRQCIAAPAGRVLVKADYSQIELRIAAKIANDREMQRAYGESGDLHTLTARALLGREFRDEAERKEARQLAKAVNFGLLYGMGATTLRGYARNSYGVEMTMEEAEKSRHTFFRTYRGLAAWHRAQPAHAVDTRTLAGRRRLAVQWFTQKLNSPVQGTGADGLKRALALLWERRQECPGAAPVIACHDEIVTECDANQAPAVKAWVRKAMLDGMAPLVQPIPVEIETQIGPSWAG